MPQVAGPYVLALGASALVRNPMQARGVTSGIRATLSNFSAYPLLVAVPNGSVLVGPWTEDLIPIQTLPGDLTVTPLPNTLPQPVNVTPTLYAQWYGEGEVVPGSYPSPLTSAALAATIAGQAGSQLAGPISGATTTQSVTPPAGSESLIIAVDGNTTAVPVVTGNTTGAQYPVNNLGGAIGTGTTFFFGTGPLGPFDTSYTVTWTSAPGFTWYVGEDSAVRQFALAGLPTITLLSIALASTPGNTGGTVGLIDTDQVGGWDIAGNLRPPLEDTNGQLFAVPSSPGAAHNDHPQNERTLTSAPAVTASGTLVAAPGAGKRFRAYHVATEAVGVASAGTPSIKVTGAAAGGVAMCLSQSTTTLLAHAVPFTDSGPGVPCPTNTAIGYTIAGTGGTWNARAELSTETV